MIYFKVYEFKKYKLQRIVQVFHSRKNIIRNIIKKSEYKTNN